MMPRPFSLLERSVPLKAGGATNRKGSFEIGGTFGGTGCWRRHSERPPGPILYSKSGADGRIRTGDPLFTKQLLCQLSYVGAAPRLYEGYEVATVVCAGSRALMVIWLTGTLSLRKVVTKVLRVGSHQVIK